MSRALAALSAAAPALAFAAGGHHAVDDASILGAGECEIETWVAHASSADRLLHAGGQCGFAGVELGIAAEPGRLEGARSDAWQAQLKWAAPLTGRAAVGLSVTPQWDTRQHLAYQGTTVAALLTLRPAQGWQVHANVGRDWLRDARQARSGAAVDWTPPHGRYLLAFERYVADRTHFARAGVRRFAGDWTFDFSRAQRLHGPRPSSWTIALTRSFGNE